MADANEVLDLYTSVVVVGTEKVLANRLDSGIDSVKSDAAHTRRLVGLQGATANTGYIIGRLDQRPVITLDMATLNGCDQIVPLDIEIPTGQELTFHAQSSSGTAAIGLTAHIIAS